MFGCFPKIKCCLNLLLLICAFSLCMTEKKADNDKLNMQLLSTEQICQLCHTVLDHWKGQVKANGTEALKSELLTSCLLLQDQAEAKKCTAGITDEKLRRLQKANAKQICEEQGLCKKGEFEKLQKEEKKTKQEQKQFPPIPEVHLNAENGTASGGSY